MADSVQFHLERMLPELEDLDKKGVFGKDEIKLIVKKRTDLEYSIHRRITKKSDYLRYIEYELNLDRLRKKRKQRLGLDVPATKDPKTGKKLGGMSLSDRSIVRRVHGLYQRALKKFPGDLELWAQYFSWGKSIGGSKALGKSYARAIQLHPTKPMVWIMAAKWEFEVNRNMTSARVLMQRGLRLNRQEKSLWHEYFKLELLWLESIRERRRILFGSSGNASLLAQVEPKEDVLEGEDDEITDASTPSDPASVPMLKEEKSLPQLRLDTDPTLAGSVESDNMEVDGEAQAAVPRSALEQALADVAIPRAVYRNAIKELPNDVEFRLGFLRLYDVFGVETTKPGQEDIINSLREDFGTDPVALAAIAERPLAGITSTNPSYPAALKNTLDEYYRQLKELPSSGLTVRLLRFLQGQLDGIDEENISKYLTLHLTKARTKAHERGYADITTYLEWSQRSGTPLEKARILDLALERFPSSPEIWSARIHVACDVAVHIHGSSSGGNSGDAAAVVEEDEETSSTTTGGGNRLLGATASMEAVFSRAVSQFSESGVAPTAVQIWQIWDPYLAYLTRKAEAVSGEECNLVESRFNQALSARKPFGLAGTAKEADAARACFRWCHQSGGIEKTRMVMDSLISLRPCSVGFFEACIEVEEYEYQVLTKSLVPAKPSLLTGTVENPMLSKTISRLRRFHESCCMADKTRIDLWIQYITFELTQAKDISKSTHLYWRASKEVSDTEELQILYEGLLNK